MKCDNSESKILSGGCYRSEATRSLTVKYDPLTDEHDTLNLCDNCAKRIKSDARKHGYKVTTQKFC